MTDFTNGLNYLYFYKENHNNLPAALCQRCQPALAG